VTLRFALDVERLGPKHEEACLCSQMVEGWPGTDTGPLVDRNLRLRLKAGADPDCCFCFGEGIEVVQDDDPVALCLANDRGNRLLRILGLPVAPYGELFLPEARRALVRARNRSSLASFVVGPVEIRGEPRKRQDGAVELRPLRSFEAGVSETSLRFYVDRFSEIVDEAGRRGATRILWG
jgi:hypothetical protein